MSDFWKNKRVLVTGATGFLGSHIIKLLKNKSLAHLSTPSSKDNDLRVAANCQKVVKGTDIVIHCAARVGGIGLNTHQPAVMFYDNILLNTHMLHEAHKVGVKKFVGVGTVCAYPKFCQVPFREESLWDGPMDESNAAFSHASKMLLVQMVAYRQQYKFNSIYLLPANFYGPGDDVNPKVSHVIPALIRKIDLAKKARSNTITVWGTGRATRDFLYIDDAARAVIMATEKYNKAEPVNIGSGQEISIAQLAQQLVELMQFKGRVIWDSTKPDGQPRRLVDTTRAYQEFGFKAKTNFKEGLGKTIKWYYETTRK